jgi:hypothetical protein
VGRRGDKSDRCDSKSDDNENGDNSAHVTSSLLKDEPGIPATKAPALDTSANSCDRSMQAPATSTRVPQRSAANDAAAWGGASVGQVIGVAAMTPADAGDATPPQPQPPASVSAVAEGTHAE